MNEIRYERAVGPNETDVVYVPVNDKGIVEVSYDILHDALTDFGFKKVEPAAPAAP